MSITPPLYWLTLKLFCPGCAWWGDFGASYSEPASDNIMTFTKCPKCNTVLTRYYSQDRGGVTVHLWRLECESFWEILDTEPAAKGEPCSTDSTSTTQPAGDWFSSIVRTIWKRLSEYNRPESRAPEPGKVGARSDLWE